MAQEHTGRFKSKEQLNGETDPRINTEGRTTSTKTNTRSIKKQELMSLLRKIKPHVADAVKAVVDIVNNPQASDMAKLRAGATIIDLHRELINEVYDKEAEEAEPIQQHTGAVVSFKMVPEVANG